MDKPVAEPEEARWLEVPDAALLLEAARVTQPARPDLEAPCAYPLLATFLLTGGRRSEVLGLEVEDVSFDRQTVTFRRNASRRRLKTRPSHRTVPLWPQLEEILKPYADRRVIEHGGHLLFPRFEESRELMLADFRKLLDRVSVRAGFSAPVLDAQGNPVRDTKGRPRVRGTLTSKMFRHTYCAARLQTLDRGAPVSLYTVSREMGHGSQDMVERVYSHLGVVRHRSEAVEYRVEQHADALAERLETLKAPI